MSAQTRVAVISYHTSPLEQPGTGDSGGMNVYIRAVAERLAAQGVEVDVFTRHRGLGEQIQDLGGGSRLIQIPAGPQAPLPKVELPAHLPVFLEGVLRHGAEEAYDVVHSHYWLSGWVGRTTKEIWGAPLVSSFHTLGKVKDRMRGRTEDAEPAERLAGEHAVIAASDKILAPTPAEAAQLVGLYGADPGRVSVVTPGVDHGLFFPRDRETAKERVHLTGVRLALFVGRLQAHKGPDVAVLAIAEAIAKDPDGTRDLVLAIVGGPSGDHHATDLSHLMELASALGIAERLMFFPPQTQSRLADFYAAADVVLVPSRSESFGLVALEAQATGTPVIAAAVGGLRQVVVDEVSGFLVGGDDAGDYARRVLDVLHDPDAARRMGVAGVEHSLRYSWDATASKILDVYRQVA